MTEEEADKHVQHIFESGTPDEKMKFAIQNTMGLCEKLDICPHCLSNIILDILDKGENAPSIHSTEQVH